MDSATLIILTTVVLMLIAIIIILLRKNSHKTKWKCVEGSCEQDMNGDYISETACKKACQEKLKQSKDQAYAWACNSNYQCIPASQGFTTKELCEQNCQVPDSNINYYPYLDYGYYPQSLWYRPWYWGSSWGGWGGRGRRGGGGRGWGGRGGGRGGGGKK